MHYSFKNVPTTKAFFMTLLHPAGSRTKAFVFLPLVALGALMLPFVIAQFARCVIRLNPFGIVFMVTALLLSIFPVSFDTTTTTTI